jgi:hypothetical protein
MSSGGSELVVFMLHVNRNDLGLISSGPPCPTEPVPPTLGFGEYSAGVHIDSPVSGVFGAVKKLV